MNNKFDEYKALRAEHPLRAAKCVLAQIKRGQVQYVKEQLRGWSFDAVTDLSSGQTTQIDLPDGGAIRVTLHHDESPVSAEGMCDIEHIHRREVVHAGVVSHVTGEYVLCSRGDCLRVTMKDSLGTAYYSRYGQSKQVAFELAVGERRQQLSYVEEVLCGDAYLVGLTVHVLNPAGKTVGEDSLWGIELNVNDPLDYLKGVAEEMYFGVVGG